MTAEPLFTYLLDKVALDFSMRLGLKRSGSMGDADTKNSRNMMRHRPPWWRHYIGVIGELVYAWFSDQKVEQKTIGHGDDGTDFPDGVQVKSSDLSHGPSLMILESQWERKQAKVYVLVWVRLDVKDPYAQLMGWITREEFKKLHVVRDYRRGPTMVVGPEHLRTIQTLKEHLHGHAIHR